MVTITCLAYEDPDRIYEYCPSLGAAILFTFVFFSTTTAHIVQSIQHRKRFCWVLIMAGLWEVGGYASRSYSVTSQTNSGVYTAQVLLILLAPLWINAFVYMVLGRMIHFFLAKDTVYGVRARKITLMFVLFDIIAFCVQLAGGLMTSGDEQPINIVRLGLKIYTCGVGLQLAFIAVFCGITFKFRQLLKQQNTLNGYGVGLSNIQASAETYEPYPGAADRDVLSIDYSLRTFSHARPMLLTISIALGLIILRNIYRLVEYGMGGVDGNTITRNEWWLYVFDAVPMFAVMIVLNVYHPGKVLQGARSDFKQADKQRKAEKVQAKAEKKEAKAAKKAAKKGKGYVEVLAGVRKTSRSDAMV